MPYKTKPCPKCGKPIRGNNATCRDCVDWSAVNRIPSASDYTLERICQSCGKSFRITHSRQYFCDECRTLSCAVCGKPFKTVFGKERLTCSPECSALLNNAPTLNCEWCGSGFKRRNGHDTHYCSKECRYEASRRYNAPERRSYRYKKWRRAVVERDNNTCQKCGATTRLHAHHIKDFEHHYELRYEVSNGVTLCADCHQRLHVELRSIEVLTPSA